MDSTFSMLVTEELVNTALKEVIDPELGINIVDLGLIYSVKIGDEGHIHVVMTLTTPGCPLHASFRNEIEAILWRSFPELQGVSVELEWEPPWTPGMMTPQGLAENPGCTTAYDADPVITSSQPIQRWRPALQPASGESKWSAGCDAFLGNGFILPDQLCFDVNLDGIAYQNTAGF